MGDRMTPRDGYRADGRGRDESIAGDGGRVSTSSTSRLERSCVTTIESYAGELPPHSCLPGQAYRVAVGMMAKLWAK
jgi:hypothetical protein